MLYSDKELAEQYREDLKRLAHHRAELIRRGYTITNGGRSLVFVDPSNLRICKETVTEVCL